MPPATANRVMSKRDERRLITAYRRMVLAGGYPNPDRVGCPGSGILKSMAFRQIDLARAAEYMEHVGCCSPCFTEYTAFREQVEKIRRLRVLAVAAMVLVAIGIGGWVWVKKRAFGPPREYRAALVDLTDRGVVRGPEEGPPKEPVELRRGALALSIYLPIGSEPADYEVEIAEESGDRLVGLVGAKGSAQFRDHIAVLEVKLDIRHLHRGLYQLAIHRAGWSWSYYPLLLK